MAGGELSDRDERRATVRASRAWIAKQGLTSAAVAVVAFACYYATLLPGLDLGDSASFQTGVGELTLTPRQAYPLYYALGNLFVWLNPSEAAAAAMNFASAVYGAAAVGLATWLAIQLTASLAGGVAGGLFLAFSYTFWSQAVTTEVYTLHLLVVGAVLIALLAWADRPTPRRLALFYGLYAAGFGNHLSMVLLLPGLTVFLLLNRRANGADPLRPSMIVLALTIAALGAAQYLWNFRGLWASHEPPASLAVAIDNFWFDVTKADWRETLVMNVSEEGLRNRPAMYWFDLRQQFGVPGVCLAAVGCVFIVFRNWRRAALLALLFVVNLAFAWTYNVGDAYIFFLPSHYVVALWAGGGVAALAWISGRMLTPRAAAAVGLLSLAYLIWRGYDTFPAVDRSGDVRAEQLLDELTASPAPGSVVFGLDSNWQLQNAIEYYMRERKPGTPWFTTDQLDWPSHERITAGFADLLSANALAGRDVVVTARTLTNAGSKSAPAASPREIVPTTFASQVKSVPVGTPYALTILRSDREYPLDQAAIAEAWSWLAPHTPQPAAATYTAVVGMVGEPPVLSVSSERPFRHAVAVGSEVFDVRIESWLPTDTIRRAGFGHVIVNRRHVLIVERGISFAAPGFFKAPLYWSGLFAPVPRYIFAGRRVGHAIVDPQ